MGELRMKMPAYHLHVSVNSLTLDSSQVRRLTGNFNAKRNDRQQPFDQKGNQDGANQGAYLVAPVDAQCGLLALRSPATVNNHMGRGEYAMCSRVRDILHCDNPREVVCLSEHPKDNIQHLVHQLRASHSAGR
jgi:hypothetical protein